MRSLVLVAPLLLAGCQTLKEASLGYADAIAGAELPGGDAPLEQVEVRLPGLVDVDPTESPSLSRYAVTREEIEAVKAGEVEVGDGSGGCGLPYPSMDLRIDAGELGPQVFARGRVEADGCATWTIDPIDLGPWFRQPTFTIDAIVDGLPSGANTLEVRVSFLVDVKDKRIQ
ncbi:hypothetical protein ACNOYE_23685 [Nannocystaceae bacterium ST9]